MYDPAARGDGRRILVERLWPRGLKHELDSNPGAWEPILDASKGRSVTLLYSAHDTLFNGALVLRDYLIARGAKGSSAPRPKRAGGRAGAKRKKKQP